MLKLLDGPSCSAVCIGHVTDLIGQFQRRVKLYAGHYDFSWKFGSWNVDSRNVHSWKIDSGKNKFRGNKVFVEIFCQELDRAFSGTK